MENKQKYLWGADIKYRIKAFEEEYMELKTTYEDYY